MLIWNGAGGNKRGQVLCEWLKTKTTHLVCLSYAETTNSWCHQNLFFTQWQQGNWLVVSLWINWWNGVIVAIYAQGALGEGMCNKGNNQGAVQKWECRLHDEIYRELENYILILISHLRTKRNEWIFTAMGLTWCKTWVCGLRGQILLKVEFMIYFVKYTSQLII